MCGHAGYETALPVGDPSKPVPRYLLVVQQTQIRLGFHEHGERPEGLSVLEDGHLDIHDPLVDDRTEQNVREADSAGFEGAFLRRDSHGVAQGKWLARRARRIHKLAALRVRNQYKGVVDGAEGAAGFDAEPAYVVVEQRRRAR